MQDPSAALRVTEGADAVAIDPGEPDADHPRPLVSALSLMVSSPCRRAFCLAFAVSLLQACSLACRCAPRKPALRTPLR
jgi:hypothetical protein